MLCNSLCDVYLKHDMNDESLKVMISFFFIIYKHDYKVQRFYYHDLCHLINQVITKLKTMSYRPFSLCRPKGIKETI